MYYCNKNKHESEQNWKVSNSLLICFFIYKSDFRNRIIGDTLIYIIGRPQNIVALFFPEKILYGLLTGQFSLLAACIFYEDSSQAQSHS